MNKIKDVIEFFEMTHVPAILCDHQGKVVSISSQFFREFSAYFLVSVNTHVDEIWREKAPNLKSYVEQLKNKSEVFTFSVIDTANNERPVTVTAKSVALGEQNKNLLVYTFELSTEVICHEQANTLSLDKILTATESAGIGTWEYVPQDNQAYFSAHMKALLGIKRSEPLDWDKFRGLIYKADQSIFDVFFLNHIELGIPLHFEFRVMVHGELHWFSLRGDVFESADGITSVVGSLQDCSAEKEILVELSNANESKKLALEAGLIGTWTGIEQHDRSWVWDWDHVTEDIFGLQSQEGIREGKWRDRIHKDDVQDLLDTLNEVVLTEMPFEVDFRVCLPDKSIKHIHAKGVVKRSTDEISRQLYGVCIDQTETIKNREQMRKLNAELEQRVAQRTQALELASERAEQANKAKSDFLAMMSHELRTPMNAIIGNLELAFSDDLKQETRSLIEISKTAADNLVSILNDILDLNKIESGKLELEDVPFSISEVIDNITKIFLPVATKKNIILDVREAPDIPKLVMGDDVRLRQILFNLLGNAIKFTATNEDRVGKIVVDVYVAEVNAALTNMIFSIKDNGIGIAKDVQNSLFSPFVQAEKSTTRKYGGTGLGLAICGKLADMMGGHIALESELHVGSTFSLHLPVWCAKEEDLPVPLLPEKQLLLANFNPYLEKVATRYKAYLTSEGAEIDVIPHKDILQQITHFEMDKYHAVIALIGENQFVQDNLNQLIEQVDRSKVVVAMDRGELDQFINGNRQYAVIPIKPTTRNQFLTQVLHFINSPKAVELELDNVELGGLDELDELAELDLFSEPGNKADTPSAEPTVAAVAEILIVEDNPFNQDLINKQMVRLGYVADTAGDGVEALAKWQGANYKLILTDCHMPEMDGYELTKNVRQIETEQGAERIPIVAITGAAMSGDKEYCLSVGMDDFISKPVKLADLKLVLEKWYGRGV